MRLSFTGGQVDCTTKTSVALTVSVISALISPFGNLPTSMFPSGLPTCFAIAAASLGLAVPENILKFLSAMLPPPLSADRREEVLYKRCCWVARINEDAELDIILCFRPYRRLR